MSCQNNINNNNNNNLNLLSFTPTMAQSCQSHLTSCQTSQTSHSPKFDMRKISYIYELPYNTRKALCDLLDADGSWRQLGGQYMQLNDTQLTLISHALYRGASPTNDLLTRWEASNPKVKQLYKYLAAMRHQRAMLVLKPFVEENLQSLCIEIEDEDEEIGAVGGLCKSNYYLEQKDGKYYQTNSINEKKIINSNLNDLDMNLWKENVNEQQNFTVKNYDKNEKSELKEENKYESNDNDDEMKVPYKELLLATDDFSTERVIGSGGFGIVYKGEWKGTQVAIKKLKGIENMSQAITELRVLNRYRIDNILPLYGVSLDGPEACLLYQYMPNGSLEDRLLCKEHTKPLSWMQRSNIGEGIARALNYLHTLKGNPLVHGDVKSANVLLDQQFEPKLGDFGLARQVIGGGMYTHCTVSAVHGTSVYLPPEYLRQKILSPAVDVYSYGIVILEMSTGRRAFDGKKLLVDFVDDAVKEVEKSTSNDFTKLMDKRMINSLESGNWFDSLLKLGRDCAQKIKKRRPQMIQVLEYYSQCKTRDKIRRLSAEVNNDVSSLPTSTLKTPLELQLWYDMVKKADGDINNFNIQNEQNDEKEFKNIQIPVPVMENNFDSKTESKTESPSQQNKTDIDYNDNDTLVLPLITELGNVNVNVNVNVNETQ